MCKELAQQPISSLCYRDRRRAVRTPEKQRERDERRRAQQRQHAQRRRAQAQQDSAGRAPGAQHKRQRPQGNLELREAGNAVKVRKYRENKLGSVKRRNAKFNRLFLGQYLGLSCALIINAG